MSKDLGIPCREHAVFWDSDLKLNVTSVHQLGVSTIRLRESSRRTSFRSVDSNKTIFHSPHSLVLSRLL